MYILQNDATLMYTLISTDFLKVGIDTKRAKDQVMNTAQHPTGRVSGRRKFVADY